MGVTMFPERADFMDLFLVLQAAVERGALKMTESAL